ncbi:hypothetical protein Vau01_086870 [Virgisporangium aurantiacum]|uniref:Secreted protein n=2 Tax=Virgisporangium aurantiacum TaxID=175570 RepID=A0A8J3ZBZ7_9ACTN|nr:hypothetical protein Vau01_086870 [Virgisporangium aurantiacum]
MLRPVLWLVLILSAAANATASAAGASAIASVGFGVITLGCAAALVVHHYRGRDRIVK